MTQRTHRTGGFRLRTRSRVLVAAAIAALLLHGRLLAFDSKGHVVIEALAYRTLVEGHDGNPPRPEILRNLFNDGALSPPLCFGWGQDPPSFCSDAAKSNPLLDWPEPLTDEPDAAFRRQFSDAGQCFHFMALLQDAASEPIPGTDIPRNLATKALVRCDDFLDILLRQIVVDGGPGTRKGGYGLYELMHAVGDSFSGSHSQRRPGSLQIEELRVWRPLTRIPGLSSEETRRIPDSAFHKWNDVRDKTYVIVDRRTADGKRCGDLTDHPYMVPYECLSAEGDAGRRAIAELLVVVHDLRLAHLAAPNPADSPQTSESWRRYKDTWFAAVYACEGEECTVQQPADLKPGGYGFLGLATQYNTSRKFFDAAATGTLLKYSSGLNPFIYALVGELGARHYKQGQTAGLAGLELDLIVPIGKRAAFGFVPAAWRIAFGADNTASELTSEFLRFDYLLSDRLALTFRGPLTLNWRRPAAELSFGLGLMYSLTDPRLAGRPLVEHHEEKVERRDETWTPPAAPYGRMEGRIASWYVGVGITTVELPAITSPGRQYGEGSIGGLLMWDRDRWGGKFAWSPDVSLDLSAKTTSGESAYLTGGLGVGLRWYLLGPFGLSVTPVRVEGGPKVRGDEELDTSPGVHGALGSQYYFQAGSRFGIAFNAGIVDILVEAPTIHWSSEPLAGHEILTVSLSIRLN